MNAQRREELTNSMEKVLKNAKSLDFTKGIHPNHGSMMISTLSTGPDSTGFLRLEDGRVIYLEGRVNQAGTAMVIEHVTVNPALLGESVALPEVEFGAPMVSSRAAFFGKK